MIQINSEVLKQFHQEGLTINEGISIDARLIKTREQRRNSPGKIRFEPLF